MAVDPPKSPPGFCPPPNKLLPDAWPVAGAEAPKSEVAGFGASAGGAPAGVVEPRLPNKGFAGVASPVGADENRELEPVVADVVGVELVPGAFPVLAPKNPDEPPPNRPPVVPPVVGVVPPAVVVGVVEGAPNALGLLAPPNRPPAGVAEGVPEELAPPNRPPAGFGALLLFDPRPPNRPPPLLACPPLAALFDAVLPKEKPEDGVVLAPPNRLPPDAAGVEEEAGAEVPGVPLPPKLNDMAAEWSVKLLGVEENGDSRNSR